jgi:glyoxylase I family protein
MITGIEHTAIMSPDPKPLAAWYRDVLGFAWCYESASTVMVKAQNGYLLEITTGSGERPAQDMKTPGIRHLAIAVSDFDGAYAALQAKGVQFLTEPQDAKGNKVVFFSDPEGNILHLLYRPTPL